MKTFSTFEGLHKDIHVRDGMPINKPDKTGTETV